MLTLSDFHGTYVGLVNIDLMMERLDWGWYTARLKARLIDPIDTALYARPPQMILEPDGLMYHGEVAEGTDTAIWEPGA
jgi:hypothetical protein